MKKQVVGLAIGLIIIGVAAGFYFLPVQKEGGVHIVYNGFSSQGAAENLSESVKVHGTVCNTGDKEAKNVTITVIFTDTAHDKVVKKTVEEGIDLFTAEEHYVEFDAEYLRVLTIPKAVVDVTIQVDWVEDGQLRTTTLPQQEGSTETEKTEVTLCVYDLLENPVYDTEVTIYGEVSLLGELFCPCFDLISYISSSPDHYTIAGVNVWYDLMVEDDGTERPSVSVEGIENGDWVIVTGELRSSTGDAPSTTFWANNIEKEAQEEYCIKADSGERMSLSGAKQIALASGCGEEGALKDTYMCNADTGTWWIDLDIEKEGCNPACVLNIATKRAGINWRCTGVIHE